MVTVSAFLISGIGLVALVLAICGALSRSRRLCISAIAVGAVLILMALAFRISVAALLSRKAALESTYCRTLNTACCAGTYINSSRGYQQFTCASSWCFANPVTSTVYGNCTGALSTSASSADSSSRSAPHSSTNCTGTSRCSGTANAHTASVCALCFYAVTCTNRTTSEGFSTTDTYCINTS